MSNPSSEGDYREQPAHNQITRTHYLGSRDFKFDQGRLTSVHLSPTRELDVINYPVFGKQPNSSYSSGHIKIPHPIGEPNVLCDVVYFNLDLPTLDPKPVGSLSRLEHRLINAARWSSSLGGKTVTLEYRSDRFEIDDFEFARIAMLKNGCLHHPELKQGVSITVVDESHVSVAVGRYVGFDREHPVSLQIPKT